jgi:predicted house-cleaning noncanonical NTP pyrophosphatase (MazG superfamily)
MAKKITNQSLPSEANVSKYEMLEKLLASIYEEMKEFSKKKPDEPLNKFKVKNVNRVLEQIKEIMKNEPTNEFLDLLDEDSLPSNSDSILVIGQFNAAMEQFRSKYFRKYQTGIGHNIWSTKENPKTFS